MGDVVTVRAGAHRLSYRITSVQTVARQALATDSQAFDQTGAHRLVLITCTGDVPPGPGRATRATWSVDRQARSAWPAEAELGCARLGQSARRAIGCAESLGSGGRDLV